MWGDERVIAESATIERCAEGWIILLDLADNLFHVDAGLHWHTDLFLAIGGAMGVAIDNGTLVTRCDVPFPGNKLIRSCCGTTHHFVNAVSEYLLCIDARRLCHLHRE